MRRPVFLKLYLSYLLLTVVVAGLILTCVLHSLRAHSIESSTRSLQKLGLTLRHQVSPLIEQDSLDGLGPLVASIAGETRVRVTIVNRRGDVLADSGNPAASMENHRNRPEVLSALTGSMGSSVRYSTTLRKDMLYVALPLETTRGVAAALRVSMPLDDIDLIVRGLRGSTLELTAAIVLFSLFIAFFFSHAVSAPIRELSRASRRIAEGNFQTRVILKTDDEIQDLAESFNDMAEHLQGSFAELSKSKEELESIISSMTEGLLVLDSRGRVLLANRSAGDILGASEITGRYSWELLRSPETGELIDGASGHPATGSVELGERSFLVSVTPIRSGGAKVVLLHDITEMKRMEKIKRDLAVNVSHELRTPLSAIKGFTETLMEESTGTPLEYLLFISSSSSNLHLHMFVFSSSFF